MIRPFTCLCLLVAAGSGLYLYSAKHDAQMLDREIGRLGRQAQDSRTRAAMMRAEYDRLGDPDRLRELATMVLSLQPTDPVQFASMADIERRLASVNAGVQANPAPFAPPPLIANAVEPPRPATAPVAMVAAATSTAEKAPLPEKPPIPEKTAAERPVPLIQVAATKPIAVPKPVVPAPQTASAPMPFVAQAPSVLASAQPMPRAPLVRAAAAAESRPTPRPTPLIEPAPRPVRGSVPQEAAFSAPASSPAAAPVFASSLGMARSQVPLPANVLTPTSYTPPRR
jgi:hypothetical protein